MKRIKSLLSRLTKPQICIILAIAACAIAGGVLVYSEWEARQPMDFTIPEPIPAVTITDTMLDIASPVPEDKLTAPLSTPTDIPITDSPDATATPKPTSTSAQQSRKPLSLKEDEIGRLIIEGKKIAIKRGVDEATLKKNVGWMESSAAPGASGVCVLMGHRDQDLRQLKKVSIGRIITVDTPDGSFAYTVYAMDIIDKDTPAQIPATEGGELMFLTCYPFYYSGSAPQQLVVRARM